MAVEIGVSLDVDNINDLRRLSDHMELLERSAESLSPAVADAERRLSLIGRSSPALEGLAGRLRRMATAANAFNAALSEGDASGAAASLRQYQQQVVKLNAALASLNRGTTARAISNDPATARTIDTVRRLSRQVDRLSQDFVAQGQQLDQAATASRRRTLDRVLTSPEDRAAQQRQRQVTTLNRQLEQLQGAIETQLPQGLDQQIRRLSRVIEASARARGRLANQPGSSFFERTRLRVIERSARRQLRQLDSTDTDPFLQQIGATQRSLARGNDEETVTRAQQQVRSLQSQLRRFQTQTVATTTGSVNRLSQAIARAATTGVRTFRRIGAAARPTSQSVNHLTNTFRRLHRIYLSFILLQGGFNLARQFTDAADEVTNLRNLLGALGGGASEVADHMRAVRDIAQDTFTPLEGAGTLYARILRSNDRLGFSLEQVRAVSESFQQALALSGADARETLAASVQFGQAISSGRLAGDEFKSLSESAPVFLQSLRDAYNEINETDISLKDFRDLGAEGELTSEVLLNLALRVVPRLNRQFQTFSRTFQHAFTVVGTGMTFFISRLAEMLDRMFGIRELLLDIGNRLSSQFGPDGPGLANIDVGQVIADVVGSIRRFLDGLLDRLQLFIAGLDFEVAFTDAGGLLGRFVQSSLRFIQRLFDIVLVTVSRIDAGAVTGFFDGITEVFERIVDPTALLDTLSPIEQSIVFVGRRIVNLFLTAWIEIIDSLTRNFDGIAAEAANVFIDLFNRISEFVYGALEDVGLVADSGDRESSRQAAEVVGQAQQALQAGDTETVQELIPQVRELLGTGDGANRADLRRAADLLEEGAEAQQRVAAAQQRLIEADAALQAERAQVVEAESARVTLEQRDESRTDAQQVVAQSLESISVLAALQGTDEGPGFFAEMDRLGDLPPLDFLEELRDGVLAAVEELDRLGDLPPLDFLGEVRGEQTFREEVVGQTSLSGQLESIARIFRDELNRPDAAAAVDEVLADFLRAQTAGEAAEDRLADRRREGDRLFGGFTESPQERVLRAEAEAQRVQQEDAQTARTAPVLVAQELEQIQERLTEVAESGAPRIDRVTPQGFTEFREGVLDEARQVADSFAGPPSDDAQEYIDSSNAAAAASRDLDTTIRQAGRLARSAPTGDDDEVLQPPELVRPGFFERLFDGLEQDFFNAAGDADISGQFRNGLKGSLNNALNTSDFSDFGEQILFALQRSLNDAFADNIIDNIFEPLFDRMRETLTRLFSPEEQVDPVDSAIDEAIETGEVFTRAQEENPQTAFLDREVLDQARNQAVEQRNAAEEAFRRGDISRAQRAEVFDAAAGQLGSVLDSENIRATAEQQAAIQAAAEEALTDAPAEETIVTQLRGVGEGFVAGFQTFISGIRDGLLNLFDNVGLGSLVDLVVGGFRRLLDTLGVSLRDEAEAPSPRRAVEETVRETIGAPAQAAPQTATSVLGAPQREVGGVVNEAIERSAACACETASTLSGSILPEQTGTTEAVREGTSVIDVELQEQHERNRQALVANLERLGDRFERAIQVQTATEAASSLLSSALGGGGGSSSSQEFADGGFVQGRAGEAVSVIAHAGELILNEEQQKRYLSGLPHFQDGGFVPGTAGSEVPIVAHAGELVLNEEQQKRYLAGLPHFQVGGYVPGVPGRAVPIVAHAGELVLNQAQQQNLLGGRSVTVNSTNNVTGNVDRPTRAFLSRNSAEIAYMVNRESRYL